jgi:hypothetical protein
MHNNMHFSLTSEAATTIGCFSLKIRDDQRIKNMHRRILEEAIVCVEETKKGS